MQQISVLSRRFHFLIFFPIKLLECGVRVVEESCVECVFTRTETKQASLV